MNITASLPVTGVGKMFKPALQQLEMESVVRAEAVRAGATIADLAHDRDGRGANVLRTRTHGNAAALQSALDRYAFRSEVLECDGAGVGKATGWQV